MKTAWDIENKTDIIDNEIELLSFATEQESIICYGAGDYANRLLVFLRAHGVDIASFCVSVGMVKNDYFCGHELYNISEIDFTQKNIGVIVAANENLHPDMREELQRRDVEAVFLSSELMNRIEKDDRYATQILINEIAFYNNCNSKRGGRLDLYSSPIHSIKEKFAKIHILQLHGNIASLISTIIYANEFLKEKLDEFFLFFPCYEGKKFQQSLCSPNDYLLEKLRGTNFDVITIENFAFWKSFMLTYPDMFDGQGGNFVGETIIPYMVNRIKHDRRYAKASQRKYIHFGQREDLEGDSYIKQKFGAHTFFCFFARDEYYWKERNQNAGNEVLDFIRNNDVDKFKKTVRYFSEHLDIYSARMGAIAPSFAGGDGCVDYANAGRSPFLDAYLNAKCKFFIGDLSGAAHFTDLFSKPRVILTPVLCFADDDMPLHLSWQRDIIIFQRYVYKDTGHRLSIREMIELEQSVLSKMHIEYGSIRNVYDAYYRKTMPQRITENEILDAAIEMNARIDGRVQYDSLDRELQERFWEIMEKSKLQRGHYMNARIGAKFLRENQWLLE